MKKENIQVTQEFSESLIEEAEKGFTQRIKERKIAVFGIVLAFFIGYSAAGLLGIKFPSLAPGKSDPLFLGNPLFLGIFGLYIAILFSTPIMPTNYFTSAYDWVKEKEIGLKILLYYFAILLISFIIYLSFGSILALTIILYSLFSIPFVILLLPHLFWSKILIKINEEAREDLAKSLLPYLPLFVLSESLLLSVIFIIPDVLFSVPYNFMLISTTILAILISYWFCIERPYHIGAKNEKDETINSLKKEREDLQRKFDDSNKVNKKLDFHHRILQLNHKIPKAREKSIYLYARSWWISSLIIPLLYALIGNPLMEHLSKLIS